MSRVHDIPNFVPISPHLGTAGQPTPEQFDIINHAGYQLVVNLATPDSSGLLPNERELVKARGMEYVAIPIVWDAPQLSDADAFFALMQANRERRVFVHCAMNRRVSAMVYLWRVLEEQVAPDVAARDMELIWTPNPTWRAFMDAVAAQRVH